MSRTVYDTRFFIEHYYYGDIVDGSFREDAPLKPSSPYASFEYSWDDGETVLGKVFIKCECIPNGLRLH